MIKKLFLLVLIFTISSCSTTAEKAEEKEREDFMNTMKDFREQGVTPVEFGNITKQSELAMRNSKFNVYITGELNSSQVILDLGNSQINKNGTSLLIPTKIINKSNQDLNLNRLTDKLYIILNSQTGDDSSQLYLLAIPDKILANNENIFISIFNFKDENQSAGFQTTLTFLKIYIDGLNSIDRPLKKKELSDLDKHEKDMQKIFKGKFVMETSMISIPLVYTIKENNVEEKTYTLGDKGPGGGWIFYDKGNFSDGWRYLEAAPIDLSEYEIWGCYEKTISDARGTTIGTGKSNTQAIVKSCGASDISAKLCTAYRGGGKKDWFLPSKDEINLMREVLYKAGIGNFSQDSYWSSSELEDENKAWIKHFGSGRELGFQKDIGLRVRAVRSF